MRRDTFFSLFIEYPYFTKDQLRLLVRKFSIPESTFNSYIHKGLRDKLIISLKKNYYVTRFFFEKHKTDISYLFLLANVLLKPSYISLETALQYYGLFAEAVHYNYISVTQKLPRLFTNRIGNYSYRNINEKLFNGFTTLKGNFEFTIALPHKAVFDYLYYYTKRFTKNVHPDLLEELRIDADVLSKNEKKSLKELVAKYTSVKIRL
ncbi:hypothetical protein HYW83_01870 [Candidatus Peregrinibacteria bacterium]|nr:hypothetical protein [Candidatus Peregrinibacteria bacterium]